MLVDYWHEKYRCTHAVARDTGTRTPTSDPVKEDGPHVCGDCRDRGGSPEHRIKLVEGV